MVHSNRRTVRRRGAAVDDATIAWAVGLDYRRPGGQRCEQRLSGPWRVGGCYWLVAVRCVPRKLYVMVDVSVWNVLPVAEGSVSVTRRWSVPPLVSAARLAMFRQSR